MRKIYLFSLTPSTSTDVIHIPTLEVEFFQQDIDFKEYDFIILTSKQAINYLLNYHDKKDFLDKKALCVSKKTATFYKDIGGDVLTNSGNYGNELVDIIKRYKDKRWLYLRANEVANDFTATLKNEDFFIDEKIVYETRCTKELKNYTFEDDAIYIFTSPSTVKCFLRYHHIKDTNTLIAIGKTTANVLKDFKNVITSQNQSVKDCIDLAKSLNNPLFK